MGAGVTEQARRRRDWVTRLNHFVTSRQDAPFEWGRHDCAMFFVAGVEAMTGTRVWRQPYHCARGALKILQPRGGLRALFLAVAMEHGWTRRRDPVREVQRGDVVALADGELRECLGIYYGAAMTTGAKGIATFDAAHILEAWEIPLC